MIKSLHGKLQEVWRSNEIELFHQEEFVERLCALPLGKIIDNIKRELAAQSQQNHPYFQVMREESARQRVLHELQFQLESSKAIASLSEGELKKVCGLLA